MCNYLQKQKKKKLRCYRKFKKNIVFEHNLAEQSDTDVLGP